MKKRQKITLSALGLAGISLVGKTIYDYKKEKPEQSLKSWFLQRYFALFSKPVSHIESHYFYEKAIDFIGKTNNKTVNVPKLDKIDISEMNIKNMQTIILNDHRDSNQKVVFFLHGGGYIAQPAPLHFNLAKELVEETDAKIVMPIYPKAPAYTFKEAYPKLLEAYKLTAEQTDSPEDITILGDSAGGGLAVGLTQLLIHEGVTQPKQLILLSPWLDASSENPTLKEYEDSDTLLLSPFYFKKTGRLWAGGDANVYHPLVSPLYSDHLGELPPTTILAGGDEMFYPDIARFKEAMRKDGGNVELYVKEKMVHDYPFFNTPEGQEARNFIHQLI